jgi:hypothetical protein
LKRIIAIPGKSIIFKLRNDEDPLILEWFDKQGQYSDSLRFLIQREIAENGIRDLQSYIPATRSVQSIRDQLQSSHIDQRSYIKSDLTESTKSYIPPVLNSVSVGNENLLENAKTMENNNERLHEQSEENKTLLQTDQSGKRAAKKTFSEDTMNSYKT